MSTSDGQPTAGSAARLERLAGMIAASPHNLVAAGARERVLEDHIAEAVALAPALPLRPGERWVDLGTGGGLPGLVLGILAPEVEWVLVDAVAKKAEAVRGFAETLGVANALVRTGRAEELARRPELRGSAAGVVSRAVGRLDVVAELARGFLAPGGLLGVVKGPRWEAEQAALHAALAPLALTPPQATRFYSPTRDSWLVTMRAVGPVPEAVPRRVGVPQRRPLGEASAREGKGG